MTQKTQKTQKVLHDLTLAKVLFQQKAIMAAMDIKPEDVAQPKEGEE